MKDRIFMVFIPLSVIACILFLVGIGMLDDDTGGIPTFAGILPVACILLFCGTYHAKKQWETYDGDNLHLPLILLLNMLYIPFYYLRIRYLKKRWPQAVVQEARKRRWVKDSLLKMVLLGCVIYWGYFVHLIISVLHRQEPSLVLYGAIMLLSFLCWIYFIHCWHVIDRKAKYLWLLILFNFFYMPFYYFRISRILREKSVV